jgi:hypothetical protein
MSYQEKLLTGELQVHILGSRLTAEQEAEAQAIAQQHGLNTSTVREALAAGLTREDLVG